MVKKINLIIFPGNFLPHIGGLETHVDEFVKRLSKNKLFSVTIFVPNVVNGKEKEIMHNNVKIIRYPAFFLVFNFPFPKFWNLTFWKLFLGLYKKDFDVVMTRTMFFSNTTLGTFFAKFRFSRLKLIHVEHASDYSKLDSKFKSFCNKFYMQTLGRTTLILADKIVSISDATNKFLNKSFNINKEDSPIIRRGFNFDKISKIKKDISIVKKYKGKKVISFVGRLIDGKGVQDVLNALKNIKEDYIFLIIGDGVYRKELERIVKNNNQKDKVKFLGQLKHDKVISILKESEIFVNPSYTEGLPTAVLDGFFTGNKILATNVGGTYEILEKAWNTKRYSLVKAKNISQIKKELLRLFKVKEKFDKTSQTQRVSDGLGIVSKKNFLKLYEKVKKKFDWEEHTKKYEEIIIEVL